MEREDDRGEWTDGEAGRCDTKGYKDTVRGETVDEKYREMLHRQARQGRQPRQRRTTGKHLVVARKQEAATAIFTIRYKFGD